MKNTLKSILLFSSVFAPTLTLADVTSEMQRYQKCFGLFVGERAPQNDPLWIKVKTGKISGTDACMSILDEAKLDENGELSKVAGKHSPIGIKVLSNFLKFHKSQMQIPDYGKVIGVGADRYTRDTTDTNEAVYHFLYSAFGKDQKYSDVVTRDYSLFAKRSSTTNRTKSILSSGTNIPTLQQGFFKSIIVDEVTQTVPDDAREGVAAFTPELVETGLLYGLVEDTRNNSFTKDRAIRAIAFTDLNINQHLGGGAIGTQAYLIGNLGKDSFNNGGTGLYRRWGKHVMEDFLCRHLPALRTTDISSEVKVASAIAFRTGSSCMACHSSMDMLSGAARNVRTAHTTNTNQINTRVKFVAKIEDTLAYSEFPTDKNDNDFYKRPANGRLFYRSYDGTIVKVDEDKIEGIADVGRAMAETNDLYVCAAKRYYKYLTGIDVDLSDIGDMNSPKFSKGQIVQREKVIGLGLSLKGHQSVRSLLKAIIESKTFIQPDKGV